jgi:hypothetical protein
MKIAVLLGRGVEGCGVTKYTKEFQDLYTNTVVYASMDKLWPRAKSMDLNVKWYHGASWDETPKASKKFPSVMNSCQVLEELLDYDIVFIFSVPSKGHDEECQQNFLRMVAALPDGKGPRVALVQHDHKIQSIHRNALLKELCEESDVLMCHSLVGPFAKWKEKQGIATPLVEMGVGRNFNKDAWIEAEDQDARYIRWVGRTAMWKGPDVMIDLHNEHFRKEGFITVLEGLEASIQYPLVLYKGGFDKTGRRDVVNYFRPEKGIDDTVKKAIVYGAEQEDMGAYLYTQFVHSEMIERMARSGFGSDLWNFKENHYGNNLQYCASDCMLAGVVPIFHKHYCDNVIHRKQGDPVSHCKNTGTIGIDHTNAANMTKLMVNLKNDPVWRDDARRMAYEFWKEHADATEVYADLITNALNTQPEDQGLAGFFG